MRTIPAYEALARDIKALGIECVFGLMSDDTALFVATLDAIGVTFHGTRHENNAISAAEGYSVATGGLGIAVLGRGPAAANSLHGAVYSQRSGSRVLLIYGDNPNTPPQPNTLGPDTKAFATAAVLTAAGLRAFTATEAASARATLAHAVDATRAGACALLLPMNVQFAQVPYDESAPAPASARLAAAPAAPKPARAPAIRAAAGLLAGSKSPIILAGLGAHRAGAREPIVRLADRLGAALLTTLKAKDMFRGHPFDAGVLGSFSHAAGRRFVEQADCVLAIGAGLNQRTTSYGLALPLDVPLIQIDSARSNIGRWYHADVAVVGDAKLAAEQLAALVPERSAAEQPLRSEALRRALAEFDLASEFQAAHTPRTVDPRSLTLALDKLLPARRNVVYDAGNFLQVVPYFSVPGPDYFKFASDFSSIGMGFGAAIGFARGHRDRPTVFFVGDGSFLMNLGELETVAREDIPLIIVLMNDCAYGAELHYLKLRDMPVAKSVFPDIDFAPVAAAFGFQTATIRTLDELQRIAPMLAKPEGPILLDCKINASVIAPFLLEGFELERRKA